MNEWMTDEKMDESISEWVLVMVKKLKKTQRVINPRWRDPPIWATIGFYFIFFGFFL